MSPMLWPTWVANGALAIIYTLVSHVAAISLLPPLTWLGNAAPREHRPWVVGAAVACVLAGVLVPAPIPILLAVMVWAGALAVRLDRFNPTGLRWRITGGLALYALASLGFAVYAAYTSRLDPRIWASVIASGEAASVVAQGRSFLNTIAVWGLWVILPLAYLALVVQGIFVHPPSPGAPAEIIHRVRARGRA